MPKLSVWTKSVPCRCHIRTGTSRNSPLSEIQPPSMSAKAIPYDFVLEALTAMSPRTHPMFGCTAVYIGKKIVLILRDRPKEPGDNGVWLATTEPHHESLRREFPNMRSIRVLGEKVTGWQNLPSDAPDFEESAVKACDLITRRDPRIGKIPKGR